MRLGDVLEKLERLEMHQAIYEELVALLGKIIEGDELLAIPVASGDGVVPARYVQEVSDLVKSMSESLANQLAAAEDAEVGDVDFDFDAG